MRTLLFALAVIVFTVGASNLLLEQLFERQVHSLLARSATGVAIHLKDQVRPLILSHPGAEAVDEALQTMLVDPRLAFVAIEGPSGQPAGSNVRDQNIWQAYRSQEANRRLGGTEAFLSQAQSVETPDHPEAISVRVPVPRDVGQVSPRSDAASAGQVRPDLMMGESESAGYLAIGVMDPEFLRSLRLIRWSASGVSFLACLIVIPLVVSFVNRLLRPIRAMATNMSAFQDGTPDLGGLPMDRRDELGALARSFASTASRLDRARGDLLTLNASLEAQVRQRTEELTLVNDRLAREIDTKNEFLRIVSHDLNAPLRNIVGMTTTIQRRFGPELPNEVNQRLERIAANSTLQASMINDLLELSRLRTMPGAAEPVDLNDLVGEIIQAMEQELIDHNIEFRVQTRLPSVSVERNLIRQVMLNLIENALKYMGERPTRRIDVSHELSDNRLRLLVADTGPGIAPDELAAIFQVFRRGSSTHAQTTQGKGIGLASVRAIVERWGGEVTAASVPGEGATFTVSLPADRIVCDDCDDLPYGDDDPEALSSAA